MQPDLTGALQQIQKMGEAFPRDGGRPDAGGS